MHEHYDTLRLVLGDQLDSRHSWFRERDATVLYVLAELRQETDYVKHHIQKLSAFFMAMQEFARHLEKAGHEVLYLTLDDTQGYPDLPSLLVALSERYDVNLFEYQSPDEYRLRQQLQQITSRLKIPVSACESEHFLLPEPEFSKYLSPSGGNRMEFFYRKMRRRYGLLMEGEQPAGGQWNYDRDNRHKLTVEDIRAIPEPRLFDNNARPVLSRLRDHRVDSFGTPQEQLAWPVNREQALQLLDYFCGQCLPYFGRFQDAMTLSSPYAWTLYHSRLSFALNCKLLGPLEVMWRAIEEYQASAGVIGLPQVEGFVRQILGWREYVRAIYWLNMPSYRSCNELGADRQLPAFFWTGNTRMQCLAEAIGQSLEHAYAHHIQRLMVIGNFCLLAGIDPAAVDAWYLGIYIDGVEWVEMPNVRGMSLYADGGLMASKPYAAGGNYINRMSDYCTQCTYKVKERYSEQACPLNSLYWRFMELHRDSLADNPRLAMVYRSWQRQPAVQRTAILDRAQCLLDDVEQL